MNPLFPMAIISISAALYHVSSKSLGKVGGANPWTVLAITYFLAFLATGVLALLSQGGSAKGSDYLAALPYALLLGLACIGIEGGYLLAYQGGSKITGFFSMTSLASTTLIFTVGFLVFKEPFSVTTFTGLLFMLTGAALTHWR